MDRMISDKRLAKSGAFWLGCERIGTFLVAVISGIILARLLEPADFGVVALATAVARIISRLASIGLGPEVMRLKEDDANYLKNLSTYFWLNLGIVLVLALLGIGGVGLSSFLKGDIFVMFMIILLGWSFNNVFSLSRSLLLKKMRFKILFYLAFVPALGTAVMAIGMALIGFGKWSLVIPQMLFLCLAAVAALFCSGFYPGLFFNAGRAGFLLVRSPWYVVTNFAEEGIERIDDIFLGKMSGAVVLGFYQRAYSTGILFHKNIGAVLDRLLMPFFFKNSADRLKVEKIYSYTIRTLIYVICSLLFAFLWYCPEIIAFVFGEKWLPAVPIFYAISVYIVCLPLYHINKNFSISQDDVAKTGQISLEILAVMAFFLVVLIRMFNAMGAAIAMDLAMLYGLIRMIRLAKKRCVISVFRTYIVPVGLCGLGFGLGWLLKFGLVPLGGVVGSFIANIVFMALWLGLVLYFYEREILNFFMKS